MKTRRLSSGGRGTIVAAALFAHLFAVHADVVNFPDTNLEAAIRSPAALDKPSGDITTADMQTLTNFNAARWGITDTSGLETAVNLTNLVFNGNPVTNYSGITGLAALVGLQMDGASVSGLSFITNLTNLKLLEVYDNQIRDVSPLVVLTGLTSLHLDWNPLTNHAPLADLTNLATLYLAGTGVTNLDFIPPLQNLTQLGLYDNQVKDISALAGRTNLLTLGLGWNGVTNPSVIATLTGLVDLQLNGNRLTNVLFLSGLTNLAGLGLDYTDLADLSPVTNLARLTWLNVGENPALTTLPNLSALTNLTTFMMAGTGISDLSGVTNLPALRDLHLQRDPIQNLEPLVNCPLLERLLLSGTRVTNLAVLAALTNLRSLEMQQMQVTNLDQVSFVTELPRLWELDLYDNQIRDLSLLTNCASLGWLSVEQNRLQHIGPLLHLPSLWYVNLLNNGIDTNTTSAAGSVITNLQGRGVQVDFDPQQPLPEPLVFLTQPANISAFVSNDVEFRVSLSGGTPGPNYRWQKDGVDLTDDVRITGTDTDTLQIAGVTAADAGFYRVRVWDDWTETNSVAAQLLIVTNVAFADANLEQAVRDELGIPTGPLTPADLAGLMSLDASSWNITNLDGLEAAANLVGLNLSDNPAIQNFAPLTFLAALNAVALNSCELDDLTAVENLRTLTGLEVAGNFIQDLSPVRNLAALQWLRVNDNYLTQIDPLLDLPDLSEVYLAENLLDTNAPAAAALVISNLIATGVYVEFDPQNFPPGTPVILTQPVNVAAYPGDNISISIVVTSAPPGLNFQWKKNGVNLEDAPDISGTLGDTLYLDDVQPDAAGSYRVRVWNEFGLTNSRTVILRVVTNVTFADANLERAVRDRLGIPTAPITLADMATMDWLDAFNYGITNLAGIEAAANLNWLSLRSNREIGDFTPLTALFRLTYLELNDCNVSNIAFVAALPPLEQLHLWNGGITDISPLLMQPGLSRLNLAYHNGITNFTTLNSLTNLEGLWMEGTGVANIAFAEGMPNLREFSFEACAVSDLNPLSGATSLVWLDMANNHITNAAPLAGCINLEWLSAGWNQITNLAFVTSLDRLWFLGVNGNAIHDLAPLTGRTNITWLDIGVNPVTNLAPIATLTRLTDLGVWNLGLSDASFLATLTNLVNLGINDNQLTSFPAYPHLAQLRYLNVEHNPLASLGFASGMTNLFYLHLNGTGLADLSALTGRTNLHVLGLAGNGISDISPLATLPHLEWVTLWDNHLHNISPLAGLTNLNYVDLRHNWLNTNAGSAAMTVIATLQGRGSTVDWDPQDVAPVPITLSNPAWLAGGQFRFTVNSAEGAFLEIQRSTNLTAWIPVAVVTNATGTMGFTNSPVPPNRQFYRVRQQ